MSFKSNPNYETTRRLKLAEDYSSHDTQEARRIYAELCEKDDLQKLFPIRDYFGGETTVPIFANGRELHQIQPAYSRSSAVRGYSAVETLTRRAFVLQQTLEMQLLTEGRINMTDPATGVNIAYNVPERQMMTLRVSRFSDVLFGLIAQGRNTPDVTVLVSGAGMILPGMPNDQLGEAENIYVKFISLPNWPSNRVTVVKGIAGYSHTFRGENPVDTVPGMWTRVMPGKIVPLTREQWRGVRIPEYEREEAYKKYVDNFKPVYDYFVQVGHCALPTLIPENVTIYKIGED